MRVDDKAYVEQARRQTLSLVAITWLLVGGAMSLSVVVVRQYVSGQVGLTGLELSIEELDNLRMLEWIVAPTITVIVTWYVGSRVYGEIRVLGRVTEWWYSFFLPIAMGVGGFAMAYYLSFGGAIQGPA